MRFSSNQKSNILAMTWDSVVTIYQPTGIPFQSDTVMKGEEPISYKVTHFDLGCCTKSHKIQREQEVNVETHEYAVT